MNPDQILAAMAEVYATCPTYRDAGRVVTRYLRPDGDQRTQVLPFRTAFVRPDRFRFEFRDDYGHGDPADRYIVWASGPDVRVWWDVQPAVERVESLDLALAGACGVSGGSARTVPSLLTGVEDGPGWPARLVEVTSLGDRMLDDGATCYRISGRYPEIDPVEEARREEEYTRLVGSGHRLPRAKHSPLTLWIDRGTFLLRRIEEQVRFERFRTEEETTYDPAVGVTIAEDELRFDPPAEPSR